MKQVLVCGATGVVGAEVVNQLAAKADELKTTGFSRGGLPGDGPMITWDLTRSLVPSELQREWDVVINCVADTSWSKPIGEAIKSNVDTVRALDQVVGPETHLIHLSTAFLGYPGTPRNTYEASKIEAEIVALELCERVTIVRPSLVIGRRSDGQVARFSGIYTILRGLLTSMVPAMVGDENSVLDLIPVDDLAVAIIDAIEYQPRSSPLIVSAGEQAIGLFSAIELMVAELNSWRQERGAAPVTAPRVFTSDQWERLVMPIVEQKMSKRQQAIIGQLSYFNAYTVLNNPIQSDVVIGPLEDAISKCVRSWAELNTRVAMLDQSPWLSGQTEESDASN